MNRLFSQVKAGIQVLPFLLIKSILYCDSKIENVQQINKKGNSYKYVVVGYGIAGKSAVNSLLHDYHVSNQSILVIDPQHQYDNQSSYSHPVHVKSQYITQLDAKNNTISFLNGEKVKYEKCLLATGSLAHTIESSKFIASDCNKSHFYDISSIESRNKLLLMAAEGKHITIMGASDWSEIQFATQFVQIASANGYYGSVTIVTPSSGLLVSTLPKYLSSSITRNLAKYGVEVITYSQLRYISNSFTNTINSGNLFIFTGCTYDGLKSNSFETDAVVFSPSIGIPRCNPSLLLSSSSSSSVTNLLNISSLDYHSLWINILENLGLEIDKDRNGIVVNRSLEAMHNIYVAGNLACLYSPIIGRGVYSSAIHAKLSGKYAAKSMVQEITEPYELIPVYEMESNEINTKLFMIGDCSTAFETHGYWWKFKSPSKQVENQNNDHNHKEFTVTKIKTAVGKEEKSINQRSMQESVWNWNNSNKKNKRSIKNNDENVILSSNNQGKGRSSEIEMRKDDNNLSEKIPPLGIIFYVDNLDIIRGIVVSGGFLNSSSSSFIESITSIVGSMIGNTIDPMDIKLSDSRITQINQMIQGSTRMMKIQHMSILAESIVINLLSLDRNYQKFVYSHLTGRFESVENENGEIILKSLSQPMYRFTTSAHSSSLHHYDTMSRNQIIPRSNKENIFFNGPVNISLADKITASYNSNLQLGTSTPSK